MIFPSIVIENATFYIQDPTRLDEIKQLLMSIKGDTTQIMKTEAEFNAKIDEINANTTASSTAAQVVSNLLAAVKVELKDQGLSASVEESVFNKLDVAASGSAALKTFLESVAAGPTEPSAVVVTPPEPTA